MTLRGSVRERRTWVRILLLQILPDLPCTMTGIQSDGDQVTASNGTMHVPLLLEDMKPHEDRLYTALHDAAFPRKHAGRGGIRRC